MPQSGFTPIQLYRSSTPTAVAPAGNLTDGELFLNFADEKLYMKNASGVVKLLASTAVSSGTVTSVSGSGGTTGLTLTGGPITNSGTLTLGGTLAVANGGTGSTTAANARTALGAAASGAVVSSGITMSSARLLGRTTASTGAIEEITIGANLTLSAGVLAATGGGGGGGTVTSVNVSGGTTGLSFSGGPITTSGTITMAGTLAVANGGTGVTGSTGSGGNFVLSASPTFTGNVNFGDGTVAAPGIRFSADTDTGFYRVGANELGVSVGGTAVLTTTSSLATFNAALALGNGVNVNDGTAAFPSLRFLNDVDTGFYSVGANQLGLSVGGTLRVTFSTTAITSTVGYSGTTGTFSGVITGSAGSSSAPAYTFAGDTDTGFYSVGANQIGVAVGGVLGTFFSSAGVLTNGLTVDGVSDIILDGAAVPATATSTASQAGIIRVDTNFIYVSTGVNTWKRVAIATW